MGSAAAPDHFAVTNHRDPASGCVTTIPLSSRCFSRAWPWCAALALAAPTLLTAPAAAQNPLGKAKAPAVRPFAGTFTGEDLRLELAWHAETAAYRGTLTVDDDALAVTGTERGGAFAGTFRADGETYRFTLTTRGAKFVLQSDGEEHELVRQDAANPPAPAPQLPNAPQGGPDALGGVGIAFQPQDGKLVVAQLAPQSPAEKAKVPLGAVLRAVDGKRVDGLQLEAVRDLIRGKIGTFVTVTIETDSEVLDVVMQRAALPGNGGPAPQPGAPAPNEPPQPGAGPLAPAADGVLPEWLRTGVRVTWFSGSASLAGVSSALVQDDNGDWVDDQGRRYRQDQVSSTGGAGFTQYDFVHVSPTAIAVANTTYVFADAQLGTVQRVATNAFSGDQNGLGDVWVPPAKLQALREQESPGYRVRRVRYPLDGRTYDAVTTQSKSQGGFQRYTYDLATGLLLVHSSSTVGQGVMTPNPNGTSSQGAGATMIAHGHLRSVRRLELPWLGQKPPEWLQQGQRIPYSGTYGNSLAEGLMAPWRYAFSATIDRRLGDAFFATLRTQLDYGTGQPPQQGQSTTVYGPGSVASLWLDPRRIQNLQPGQVLDRDPITNWQVTFAGRDAQTATIVEQGPLESQSYTYDLRSGQLVASSVRQRQGPATLAIDVQLVR